MKKREVVDIGSVLKKIMDQNPLLRTGIAEERVLNAWNETLGEGVAKCTSNIYFKRGILFVHLTSSVLRAELMMNKKNLINKLNECAEMQIIKDIILR